MIFSKSGLEEIAVKRKIMIHEPFAEFLHAKPTPHTFEISLLDCHQFVGLSGKFVRKNLLTYGNSDISPEAIRFRRLSTNDSVTLEYNPSISTSALKDVPAFPDSWRTEVCAILENSGRTIKITHSTMKSSCASSTGSNGCC